MNDFDKAIELLDEVLHTSEGCQLPMKEIAEFLDKDKSEIVDYFDLAESHFKLSRENVELTSELTKINELSQRWLFRNEEVKK